MRGYAAARHHPGMLIGVLLPGSPGPESGWVVAILHRLP
jgi:hypothetical protein